MKDFVENIAQINFGAALDIIRIHGEIVIVLVILSIAFLFFVYVMCAVHRQHMQCLQQHRQYIYEMRMANLDDALRKQNRSSKKK